MERMEKPEGFMPGYQRFVAYVYEYRKGRKEENCGFIRVEAREEQCGIEVHVRCPGLPANVPCEMKGIVRNSEGVKGVTIGTCRTLQDGIECMFSCMTDNLDHAGTSLTDIGGLLLVTDGGAFFGTEWDDVPIVPDEFMQSSHNVEKGQQSIQKTETLSNKDVSDAEQPENTIEIPQNPAPDNHQFDMSPKNPSILEETVKTESCEEEEIGFKTENEIEAELKSQPDQKSIQIENVENEETEITSTDETQSNAASNDEKTELIAQEIQMNFGEETDQNKPALKPTDQETGPTEEYENRQKNESALDAANPKNQNSEEQIPKNTHVHQANPENSQEQVTEISETNIGKRFISEERDSENKYSRGSASTFQKEQKQEKLTGNKSTAPSTLPGESATPFSDGEITDCRRIQPQDLRYLAPCDRTIRNNRFLAHGYYQFGHILIGKTSSGQYIIGVPGGYDQQERFMAGMHGFPYFKESQDIRLRQARGGYWYRLIHTPNFYQRNGM